MEKKKIVISLGGSLLTEDFSVNGVRKYIYLLKKIDNITKRFVIIVGGGRICREYQAIANKLGSSQDMEDYIGTKSTHFNASLVASALEDYVEIPNNEEEMLFALKHKKLVVGGGLRVGQSNDAVAAFCAKIIKADLLINASNVDGVYDCDPKQNKNAKKIPNLNYAELKNILSKNPQLPGKYGLFDLRAAETILKSKINTVFIDGRDPQNILKAIKGEKIGTLISQ